VVSNFPNLSLIAVQTHMVNCPVGEGIRSAHGNAPKGIRTLGYSPLVTKLALKGEFFLRV
jgi:hypothetical protein